MACLEPPFFIVRCTDHFTRRTNNDMRIPLMLAALLLPLAAHAFSPNGLAFSLNDWELACDNTGTCRAAGYCSDEPAVSVLLTRKAGAQEPVSGQVMLGEYGENPALATLPAKFRLTLKVNGKAFGQLEFSKSSLISNLSQEQVNALLHALPRHANIEFVGKRDTWVLSDQGAAAVLLKMDEYQGRVGTAGAIVRKGRLPESSVPAATPAPTITRVAYAKAQPGDDRFIELNRTALLAALRTTIKDEYCDALTADDAPEPELSAKRLTATQMLVSTRCWRAIYNAGDGYWIVSHKAPFNPVLVSTSISEGGTDELSESHKGRGLGDCWSSRAFTWDGKQFRISEQSTTGMCRLMAPGGAWTLPTVVTNVR